MPKGNKARKDGELVAIKSIIRNMWVFEGYSIRKIESEFNANYSDQYGTVSFNSVAIYVREIRRELENWLDEDALEKYTGEFVRQQHIIDNSIENLRKVQKLIEMEDPKGQELYLKFENAIHNMTNDKIKMMSEIELVLRIKKLNKEQRKKNETLTLLDEDGKKIDDKTQLMANRGYIIPSLEDKDVKEDNNDQNQ